MTTKPCLLSFSLKHGMGMKEPLVDSSGFPRSDVDVHTIRTLRNQIVRLQNDHRQIMNDIEQALHQIHQEAKATGNVRSTSTSFSENDIKGEI